MAEYEPRARGPSVLTVRITAAGAYRPWLQCGLGREASSTLFRLARARTPPGPQAGALSGLVEDRNRNGKIFFKFTQRVYSPWNSPTRSGRWCRKTSTLWITSHYQRGLAPDKGATSTPSSSAPGSPA